MPIMATRVKTGKTSILCGSLIWPLFLFGFAFALVSQMFDPPWVAWMGNNMNEGHAIVNLIVICAAGSLLLMLKKPWPCVRSLLIVLFFFAASLWKASFDIAPALSISTGLFLVVLALVNKIIRRAR